MNKPITRVLVVMAILALLVGCGSEEPVTLNSHATGKPQIPLASENKEAYVKMIKDQRNARLQGITSKQQLVAYLKTKGMKTFRDLKGLFGKPDAMEDIGAPGYHYAIYYNFIVNNGLVESVAFNIGSVSDKVNDDMPFNGDLFITRAAVYFVAQ